VRTLAGTGSASAKEKDEVKKLPFLLLSLDLPPARLFQDAMETNIIPQVLVCFFPVLKCSPPARLLQRRMYVMMQFPMSYHRSTAQLTS
jgi:hypothetical protein